MTDKYTLAFPHVIQASAEQPFAKVMDGMTLRDYFAAKAMQALVSDPGRVKDASKISKTAYLYADTMLEARDGDV